MPSSAVRRFTDSDDYAAAIRATRAEITVTGRGHFTAKLTTNGRAIISFRTPGAKPAVGRCGNEAGQHHATQ